MKAFLFGALFAVGAYFVWSHYGSEIKSVARDTTATALQKTADQVAGRR